LISQDKIDEWIREVQERPASAELIIRYIANRLSELSSRADELAADNIELLSGRKVEEYENRIASLEYQLELLKRQFGGEVILPSEVPALKPMVETINLLVYNPLGQVLRLEIDPTSLVSGETLAVLNAQAPPGDTPINLLVTGSREELLFIFDSGRTVAMPVSQVPLSNKVDLDWTQAFIQEPQVKEELAAIQPIAKMTLYETCLQASRRGFVKKMKTSFLASHITENYIGSGVKVRADKTWGITFANKDDAYSLVSQEGYIFSMQVERLPVAIDEVIRLGITDHIVSAFIVGQKPSILFITQNGKAVHRDASWLEAATSFKTKGQALLSRERREGGTRIVGAAPVDDEAWGVFLHGDGAITSYQLRELISSGSIPSGKSSGVVLSFWCFTRPEATPKPNRDRSDQRS